MSLILLGGFIAYFLKAEYQKEKEAIQKQEQERKLQLASLDSESKEKLESLEKNYLERI